MATYRGKCWQFGLAGAFVMSGVALKDNYVLAQITPDATLGTERSVVIPNAPVGDLTADQIGGGALRGTNLFHSFSEFNVANGQRVYFANPVGIENIFSRVTGNNVSEILGTLGVDGTANLFLLNPNGIIFGPNARLDIAGSFFASTANSLVFENGVQFSATNPQAPPLLTINVTPGLQYGRDRLKPIVSAGNLAVGQNLTLAAGTLNLQGQLYADGDLSLLATDAVQIRDSPANPFIAAARGQLLVQGDRKLDIFALNHPESGFFSGEAMLLRSANPVQGDAHYTTGGRFRIEQLDGTLGDLSSPGDPIIRAGGDVSINTYQGASLHIFAGGQVDLGTVTITGADAGTAGVNFIVEDVTLSDATEIAINGGTQPTLDVRAGMNPAEIDGALGLSGVFGVLNPANPVTQTRTSGDINIGSISINAPNGLVFLTNQYKPDPSLSGGVVALGTIRTDDASGGFLGNGGSVVIDARGGITIGDRIDASSGSGDAGNITLIAQDALLQAGRSEASIALDNSFIVSNTKGPGQGGDIAIRTGSLSAINGAQIESSTEGQGNAGRVTIDARDTVRFDGVTAQGRSGIVNSIKRGATGNSGGVEITTGSLFVLNGAQLQARAEGQGGESGDITIVARDTVSFDGVGRIGGNSSAAITSLERDNIGRAGNILIRAGSVSLTNGGQLQSNTIGVGDAGDVTIIADGQVLIDGEAPNRRSSEILLRVNKEGIGNGGNITIEADSLSLTGGAQLITKTEGQGDAGNVRIVARNSVSFDGVSVSDRGRRSGVISSVAAGGVGNGGAIDIQTKLLSVTNEARVDASTLGTGDARDLTISTEKLTIRDGASILASTFGPFDAGDIIVNATDSVVIAHDGVIASAVTEDATGNGGDIKIETGSLYLVDGGRVETRTLGFIPAALASQYANTPYDVAVLADNPVAYWRLDETSGTTAVDASGNNFNGTYQNGVTLGQAGVSGTGVQFDRQNQGTVAINAIAPGSSLDIQNQSFTVEAWIKPDDSPPQEQAYFGMRSNTQNTLSLSLGVERNGALYSRIDNNNLDTRPDIVAFGDNWYHVVTRYDALTDTSTLFVNGVQLRTGSQGPLQGNQISVLIGSGNGRQGNNTQRFDGLIDEVAVYNSALSSESVTAHYYTGQRNLGIPSEPFSDSGANAGNITVNAESVILSGVSPTQGFSSGLFSGTEGNLSGQGGNINVNADSLRVADGAVLSARTLSQSNGGTINVNATTVEATGGGQLLTTTLGSGQAGEIIVNVTESISLAGSDPTYRDRLAQFGAATIENDGTASGFSARTQGTGAAGNLQIETGQFRIRDGAQVSAATAGGEGGSIALTANTFEATSGGRLLTRTSSNQRAGNITLNVDDRITLADQGTGLFADTASGSTGSGGDVMLTTGELLVRDGARVALDAEGSGDAGTLDITARLIELKNQGQLTAETASGNGGNIRLHVQDLLLLRHNSLISTTAGNDKAGGDGGNITIDTGFIVAVPEENSDIAADAFEGRGGNINIAAQGIFGIEFRENRTPLSDITASSQLGVDGVVEINRPDVDPSRGLAELPSDLVNAAGLVDRSCGVRARKTTSRFVVTGRGGLPPAPTEALSGDTVWSDLRLHVQQAENSASSVNHSTNRTPVEAQGWVKTSDGQVILVAQASEESPFCSSLQH